MAHDVRIGISGWTYAPWRGTFFPKGLPRNQELRYAAGRFRSIEINGTFYSLQRSSSFAAWHDHTPDDFVFSVKAPRFITHILRLRDARTAVANFMASGLLRLGPKLGPLLWQLPPSFHLDLPLLAGFFRQLPRSTARAAALARRHDSHVHHGVWLKADADLPLRHALEVRHASFETPGFLSLLREHEIGLVVADTAGRWPAFLQTTADFVYVRLHGAEELYASGYTPAALKAWAARIAAWRRRRDVFVYFDNDVKVRAPFDAMSLATKLGCGATDPD